jgi:hypothetical protein
MRMLQAAFFALLTVLAVLFLPASAQADCASTCEGERQQCLSTQCPTMFWCEECDGVYNSCMSYCLPQETGCIPPGGTDDVLYQTSCCSGNAVHGSTYCSNPCDWGTTWASCTQICA